MEKFKELTNLFTNECERVAKCLSESIAFKYDDIRCARKFTMDIDCSHVDWEGWAGGCEQGGSFNIEYLLMSDDELKEMVAKSNREIEEKKKIMRLAQEKRELEAKKAEYERLKKELGYDK